MVPSNAERNRLTWNRGSRGWGRNRMESMEPFALLALTDVRPAAVIWRAVPSNVSAPPAELPDVSEGEIERFIKQERCG